MDRHFFVGGTGIRSQAAEQNSGAGSSQQSLNKVSPTELAGDRSVALPSSRATLTD